MTRNAPATTPILMMGLLLAVLGRSTELMTAAAPSDPKAVELARGALDKMGGEQAWNETRYIRWDFFGRRTHYWDKWSGNDRIESENGVAIINANTREGRVWENGQEITDPAALGEALEQAHRQWVNDSYWLVMPYKLLDPGVTLKYVGEEDMEDGRPADVLELTFEGVGYTPNNRYLVSVGKDSGLVEQWAHFREATDTEPRFTLPWTGWERFGRILLSTDRGRDADWKIAVYDDLPASVFTSPEPVQIP